MNSKQRWYLQSFGIVAGACLGILVGVWISSPKYSPEEMAIREHEYLLGKQRAERDQNAQDMQGRCEDTVIKTLRSGLIAVCVDGKWGIPTSLGLEGSDGVFRRVPPYCGPEAHVITDPKYGQLCVQNEGVWRVATVAEAAAPAVPTCLPLPGTPPGILDMCAHLLDGKTVIHSAPAAN
ncbi:MAG: hypothetical protein KAX55_04025 [Propionivibrio sp.]|nr:hypothetical protein [Propionivibrio sp.]